MTYSDGRTIRFDTTTITRGVFRPRMAVSYRSIPLGEYGDTTLRGGEPLCALCPPCVANRTEGEQLSKDGMKNVNRDQNGRVRIRPVSAKAKAKRSKSLPTAVQCPDDDEHRSLSVISPRAAYIPPYPVDFHNRADRYTLRTYLDLNAFDGIARCLRAGVELDRHIRCALADKLDPPIKSKKTAYYSWKRGRGIPRSGRLDPLENAMNGGDLVVIANHLRTSEDVDQRVLMWLANQFDPPSQYRSRFQIKGPRTRPPSKEQIAKYMYRRNRCAKPSARRIAGCSAKRGGA